MDDPTPQRRVLPPFEQTLAGLAPPLGVVSFDATIGREALSETLVAPSLGGDPPPLPTLSLDFGEGHEPAPLVGGPDLRIVGRLGEGGMGIVHLAEQRSLRRLVAIKTSRRDVQGSADAALCEEAGVTGGLEHPNIVPVHAFGRTADGRPAMVMKRIEGVPWRTLLAEPDHPTWEAIGTGDRLVDHLSILMQISNALAFAHAHRIVHRDVKPENVLVGGYGEVVLVDFGLAVHLDRAAGEATRVVGTPAYMAPEMVAGLAVDERTDVYLLGATLHEILTGHAPHDGDTLVEVLAHAYASPTPRFDASVPHELGELCRAAMARDAEDRIPSARAFRSLVADYLTHRASYRLVERAQERVLDALRASTAAGRRAALTEARFACRQAIEQWDENPNARRVERESTEAAIELELSERNGAGARALLDSLDPGSPALEARVAELEALLAGERHGAERLRALERERDVSVGAGARRNAVLAIAVVGATLGIYAVRRSDAGALHLVDLVRIGLVMFVFVTISIVVFWKRLGRNQVGRQLAIVGWLSNVAMVVHRLLALAADQAPAHVLASDSMIFTAMLAVVAVVVDPWLLVGVPITLAGAAVSALRPELASRSFGVSTIVLLVVAAIYFRRMQARESA